MPSRHLDEPGWPLALGQQLLVDVPQLQTIDQVTRQVVGIAGRVTWTLDIILRMITSKCLSLMF